MAITWFDLTSSLTVVPYLPSPSFITDLLLFHSLSLPFTPVYEGVMMKYSSSLSYTSSCSSTYAFYGFAGSVAFSKIVFHLFSGYATNSSGMASGLTKAGM